MGIVSEVEDFIEPFINQEAVVNDIGDIQIKDGLFSCALIRRRENCPPLVVGRILMTTNDVLLCSNKAIRAVTKRMLGMN